nr:MAG TPA: hypothetical protein [Microviridae sp.]
MKKSKRFESVDLYVDVVDYMFIEWLVRQGLFAAFVANYDRSFCNGKSFRETLRVVLRHKFSSGNPRLGHLVSGFFMFDDSPEGYRFWEEKSLAWVRFCKTFQTKF